MFHKSPVLGRSILHWWNFMLSESSPTSRELKSPPDFMRPFVIFFILLSICSIIQIFPNECHKSFNYMTTDIFTWTRDISIKLSHGMLIYNKNKHKKCSFSIELFKILWLGMAPRHIEAGKGVPSLGSTNSPGTGGENRDGNSVKNVNQTTRALFIYPTPCTFFWIS